MATISPLSLVADLASGNRASGSGPLTTIRGQIATAQARSDGWWGWFPDTINWSRVNEAAARAKALDGPPPWVLSCIFLGLAAAALSLLAARRLRTPAETER